jgi:mRNA interferase RelE/StbE
VAAAKHQSARLYSISFKPQAERDLKKIKDRRIVRRIVDAISALGRNPRPAGVKALQGDTSILRLRVGDYRILYTVVDTDLLVLVVTVGHRREVYR